MERNSSPSALNQRGGLVRLAALCAVAVLTAAGCKEDVISRYRVPKEPRQAKRLLGAILPHGEKTWYVKLSGPEETVSEHEEAFEQFVQSIRFPDDGEPPITWETPEGWKKVPNENKRRYATFHMGPADSAAELLVTALGGDSGTLLANVNRWRGQIGLPHATEADLPKLTREITVDGKPVTLVDMTAEPVAAAPPGARPNPATPTYKLPEGWEKSDKRVPFSIATFEVSEGGRSADVTISPLKAGAGGLLMNVNRWRRQVGLGPVGAEELPKAGLRKIEVAGAEAHYADFVGPESAGEKRQRILAVMLPRQRHTWFFKMTGPPELVEKQKPAFEEFVKSVRFDKGAGVKP